MAAITLVQELTREVFTTYSSAQIGPAVCQSSRRPRSTLLRGAVSRDTSPRTAESDVVRTVAVNCQSGVSNASAQSSTHNRKVARPNAVSPQVFNESRKPVVSG